MSVSEFLLCDQCLFLYLKCNLIGWIDLLRENGDISAEVKVDMNFLLFD